MRFRVGTLNLEQDHKRWDARRELIQAEIGRLKPDIMAFNEVCIPLQSARGLRDAATALTGTEYKLVQQTRVNGLSKVEGEALLTRFEIVETGNFDFQTKDIVALVARVLVDGSPLDVYVTHLFMSRGDDSLRLFQVQQLLGWIDTRDDVTASIVCGDFNATLDAPSAALMATRFRPTQTQPSGSRGRSGSLTAAFALISPARKTRHCGPPTISACGPISSWAVSVQVCPL
jgi:endonuclease/exonuclease/phosphatase family metal-dependent hydrolase